MRKQIVAGNWKMFGSHESIDILCSTLTSQYQESCHAELVVFPPAIYIPQVASKLAESSIQWGAQNVSAFDSGAYTGEIAADMLLDFGCRYVLVGHSERRELFHERDQDVALKYQQAISKKLIPILCVGETLEERKAGQTQMRIKSQIDAVLALQDGVQLFAKAVVAYEPVWAIGTGLTATPEEAQSVHAFIRQMIGEYDAAIAGSLPILYGGSVKPVNAVALFAMPDIDGGLIGGASLSAIDFLEIASCIK